MGLPYTVVLHIGADHMQKGKVSWSFWTGNPGTSRWLKGGTLKMPASAPQTPDAWVFFARTKGLLKGYQVLSYEPDNMRSGSRANIKLQKY